MDVMERIRKMVQENPVVLFMKGTPQFPMCGFSSRAAQALRATGEKFAYVNVLEDKEIYENLPKFADWPTFPQVFVGGELIGGCDITVELAQKGELQPLVQKAVAAKAGA